MENKKIILKGRELHGDPTQRINIRALSLKANISIPAIYKMLDRPEEIKFLDMSMLYRYLTAGLGKSDAEVLETRLGDIFEIREE